jgi:hypothetical protein
MKKLLIAVLMALSAAVCQAQMTVQFQNAGTPIGTFKKWLPINCSTNLTCTMVSGVVTMTVSGSGSGTVTVAGSGNLTSTALVTGAGTQVVQTPSATSTLDSSGDISLAGTVTAAGAISSTSDGTHAGSVQLIGNTTNPVLNANSFVWGAPLSASFTSWGVNPANAEPGSAGIGHYGAASGHMSAFTISPIVAADITNNTITHSQVAASVLSTDSTAHAVQAPWLCADTSSSATTYTCTTTPTFTPAAGDAVTFSAVNQTNSGASTLNVDGHGAKPITKWQSSTALASGDLVASAAVTMVYDGTNWELATQGQAPAGGGSGTVSGQSNGVIPLATNTTIIGAQSALSDNGTTVSSSEPVSVSVAGSLTPLTTTQTGTLAAANPGTAAANVAAVTGIAGGNALSGVNVGGHGADHIETLPAQGTYSNENASCTGSGTPIACCTGSGTGTCGPTSVLTGPRAQLLNERNGMFWLQTPGGYPNNGDAGNAYPGSFQHHSYYSPTDRRTNTVLSASASHQEMPMMMWDGGQWNHSVMATVSISAVGSGYANTGDVASFVCGTGTAGSPWVNLTASGGQLTGATVFLIPGTTIPVAGSDCTAGTYTLTGGSGTGGSVTITTAGGPTWQFIILRHVPLTPGGNGWVYNENSANDDLLGTIWTPGPTPPSQSPFIFGNTGGGIAIIPFGGGGQILGFAGETYIDGFGGGLHLGATCSTPTSCSDSLIFPNGTINTQILGTLSLGTSGSHVGSLIVNNATSGAITVNPPTGALGSVTLQWPDIAGTLASSGTGPVSITAAGSGAGGVVSLQNSTPANITALTGTDTLIPTNSGSFTTNDVTVGDAQGGIKDSGTLLSSLQSGGCTSGCEFSIGSEGMGIGTGGAVVGTVLHPNFIRFFNLTQKKLGATALFNVTTFSASSHFHAGIYSLSGSTWSLQYDMGQQSGAATGVVPATGLTPFTMLANTNYLEVYCADNTTEVLFAEGHSVGSAANSYSTVLGSASATASTYGQDATDVCTASAAALPATMSTSNMANATTNVQVPFVTIVN